MTYRNARSLACVIALLGAVIGCDKAADPDTTPAATVDDAPLFAAPAFSLTDQDGKPFGSDQLKGKVWIVTLFYTSCPGPCPMMTGRLKKIQDKLDNPDIETVSISVDPDHDTPAKMKDYATAVGAKVGRWAFLTGTPAQVQQVADGLKLGYEPGKANDGPDRPLDEIPSGRQVRPGPWRLSHRRQRFDDPAPGRCRQISQVIQPSCTAKNCSPPSTPASTA